jgi:hypothetical protein
MKSIEPRSIKEEFLCVTQCPSWFKLLAASLLLFRGQRQAKNRNHSLPRHINFGFFGIRQIQRLAMLAAVDLGVGSPRFFRVAAGLLDDVAGIKPALQMTAAEFSLFVLLIARTLPGFFGFDFMMRKLRRSLRARSRDFASRQRTHPRSRGACAAGFGSYERHCTRSGKPNQCPRCRMLANSSRAIFDKFHRAFLRTL